MSRPAASTTATAPTATVAATIGSEGHASVCTSGCVASIQPSGVVQRTQRSVVPLSAIIRNTNEDAEDGGGQSRGLPARRRELAAERADRHEQRGRRDQA